MMVFVDTSAFYAVLDRAGENHADALRRWDRILSDDVAMVSSNYVLVETCALLQNRIGLEAVRTFHEDVLPLIQIEWISKSIHDAAIAAVLAAGRKKLSLVDCTSFQVMRDAVIRKVFCFDRHFAAQACIERSENQIWAPN